MKFFYTLLVVVAFAACTLAEAEAPAAPAVEKKQNWFQGVWNKVQEINPFDDMFNHLKSQFENSAQGKEAEDGEGNPIIELLVWVFENKDQILKYIETGVQDVLNNIKRENPVCEVLNHLKDANILPTNKNVSSEQLKTVMEKLDALKEVNPIVKLFYGPISNAVEKFSKSNPLCGLLDQFQKTHPVFAIIKNLAKVNASFATLEDIFNESKQCLCDLVNPAEIVMQIVG